MSQYQTGELAKLKNVSVRTIQYYDRKGLLKTVQTAKNGRRIFDEQSKQDLEIILILKAFNFSLKDIKTILNEKNKLKTVRVMLEQKELEIEKEMQSHKTLLAEIRQFKQSVLYRVIPIGIFQYTALIASMVTKKWWPLLSTSPILFTYAVNFTIFTYTALSYVCPNCQATFKPNLKQWMFSAHTPKTRKLQCPHCDQDHHCVAIVQS
ncbi:MerR family transcriptional regulator [Staphylococcus saprophyticus]|uniref:MerR family transcriptional regulator n=1 Tax=Staphylococcus saprophyticus TaxID=29385 RepID=UPI00398B5056